MRISRSWFAFAALVAAGCGSSAPLPGAAPKRPPSVIGSVPLKGLPALQAAELAKVPDGTFGPYVGESNRGGLVVWAATEEAGRGWFTRPVSGDGTPVGDARRIADAPPDVGLVVVRGGPDASQLAILSTRRTGLGEWVEVTLVRSSGELAKEPRALVELPTHALWVETVTLGERRLVAWAVQTEGTAALHGVVLGANGEPESDPKPLVPAGVRGWQLVGFAGGAALGVVRADAAVEVTLLDARGQVRGKPLVLSEAGHAELDLELASLGDALLVAWSDQRDGESRVYRAVVGSDGAIRVPAGPLTSPVGEQALVRMVARPGTPRAFIAWESPTERDGSARAFDIVSVDASGRAGAERGRLRFDSEDAAVPEIAAVADGVAALTLGVACTREAANCEEADVLPTFVRFGAGLEVKASEPFRLEPLGGGPAELGFALSCGATQCFALASVGQAPAPVYAVNLERRSSGFRPAARRIAAAERPNIRENRVLASTDALADVALTRAGTGTLAAYLTDFDPTTPWVKLKTKAPDGRFEPLRARLELIGLKPDGSAFAPPTPLSIRAHSLGGISLAPAVTGPRGGVSEQLAAWTGVDLGHPQVFLTLVGPDGARRSQRMLTRKSGDASDVATAAIQNGWLVAWVDERDKDPELYATRVDGKLARIGNEQRLTKAPGPATQVTLAPLGETAVVAWADARDPQQPGEADIYVSRIATRDATPLGAERSVLPSRGHSFAPALEPFDGGLLLAWLERGTQDVEGSAAVVVEVLDGAGAAKGEPRRFPLERGEPGALAVDCAPDVCHFVVSVRSGAEASLFGGAFAPGGSSLALKKLAALGSKTAAGVPLGLEGNDLVYADSDSEGRWKFRRAVIDWR
jgi:hypothetical protein